MAYAWQRPQLSGSRSLLRKLSQPCIEWAASFAAPETGDAGTRGNTRTLAPSPCNAVCSTTLPRRFLSLRKLPLKRSIAVNDIAKHLYTFQGILGCTVRSDICQCYGLFSPTWTDTKKPAKAGWQSGSSRRREKLPKECSAESPWLPAPLGTLVLDVRDVRVSPHPRRGPRRSRR